MRFTYDPRRTAQAAEWLLHRHGDRLTRLVLLKLLYLADRRSLLSTGAPLTGDYTVSMDLGPVLSITYDLIKGSSGNAEVDAIWAEHVASVPNTMQVRAVRPAPRPGFERKAYDQLSPQDLSILLEVDETFGHLSWKALSDFTHQLPEWEDPAGSMRPIAPETILAAEGMSEEQVLTIAREAEENRRLRELLGFA